MLIVQRQAADMKVLFWFRKSLKKGADSEQGTIQIRITIEGTTTDIGTTGVSCLKTHWSATGQNITTTSIRGKRGNQILQNVSSTLYRIFDVLHTKFEYITTDLVKEHYHEKRKFVYTLPEIFTMFSDHREWQAGKGIITQSTVAVCTNYTRHIKDYISLAGYKLPAQVPSTFFGDLYEFIIEKDRGGERFARKIVTYAKQALMWGKNKQYMPRLLAFDEAMPGAVESEKWIDTSHLTIYQLKALMNYNFYQDLHYGIITKQSAETLSKERDAFVFNCFTGMHHCDYVRKEFTIEPYGDALFLRGTRLKTGISFAIKLLEPAVEILRRYNNKLENLPIKSNQKRNDSLKLIASFVRLPIRLTTKIARKTFCDMALNEMLMSPDDVAVCLGLTNTKYLCNYGRIRESRLLETMKDWHLLKHAS